MLDLKVSFSLEDKIHIFNNLAFNPNKLYQFMPCYPGRKAHLY